MTVGQIFTNIGTFIENRQIFMLLNWNCAKLANFENFKSCLGGPFFRGHSVEQLILYSTEVHRDTVLNSSKASSDLKKLSKHSMIMCDSCQTV